MASREITTLSSAEERARAAEQLRAAQIEFKSSIQSLPADATTTDWNRLGQQIASKYDYVDFSIGSQPTQVEGGPLQVGVSTGEFFVKGYGTNAEFETYKSPVLANRDDAYISPGSSTTSTQTLRDSTNNQAAREPPSGSAADAPGLSGSKTSVASETNATQGNGSTYSSTAVDGAGGPNPANTTPVTQNGDAASTGGSGSSTYNARESDGSASSTPGSSSTSGQSDDAGSTGGTGTGGNNGNSTGGSTDGSNNGTNNNGVSVGQAGQGSQLEKPGSKGTKQNTRIFQRRNTLHNYVNWTYQVGWYMLDVNTFNNFVRTNVDSADLRKKPIMRTGGFVKKSQGLDYDLNLIDLEIENTIGNNTDSPGSNIYSIRMTVMEPYGVSLIESLKQMAGDSDDPLHIPYLLELKWVGYDDKGNLINNIPDSGPKLLPVSIVKVHFDIDSAGTTYKITMVPYTQTAINRTEGVIRQDINLYGDSLQTLLKEGPDSLKQFLTNKSEDDKAKGLAEYSDEYDFEIISFDPGNRSRNNKLATSKITFPQKGGEGTVLSRRGTPNEYEATKTNDPTRQYISFRGGTTIVAAIVEMAKYSKYYQDLITEDPNSDKQNPMELIKVVPVVSELKNYDNIRRTYQKRTVYKIMPYFEYGKLYPYAGQADVEKRGFVKEYNWIFTGKNEDILDLKLEYNNTYFRVFQKAQEEKSALNTGAITQPRSTDKSPIGASDSITGPRTMTGQVSTNPKGFRPDSVAEYFDMALNDPQRSEQAILELDIIGDPDWITQDRSVRPKGNDVNANNSGYVDNDYKMGIAVDVDAVYVKLIFRTPRDYSDTTGLMNLSAKRSFIEGVYKVVRVSSRFSNGTFMQTLKLARVDQQTENKPVASGSMADARAQDRNSVDGYTSPKQQQQAKKQSSSVSYLPAINDKASSLGDPVASALYNTGGRPNQATPTNPADRATQDYFMGTNNNPSLGDDRGR